MINFYNLIEPARLALVFLIGITIFSQTITFLLSIYRKLYSKIYLRKDLFELMIIVNLMTMALILGQALNAYQISIVPSLSYVSLRKTVFYIILLLSIILTYNTRKIIYFLGLLGSLIILPEIEILTHKSYLLFYTLSILMLLARSLLITVSSIKHIRTKVSALSIVQTINTLDTGILYSKSNGRIVLINDKMQELMILLTGRIYRNANDFYNFIERRNEKSLYEGSDLKIKNVCLMRGGSAWVFNKQEIILPNKVYNHISATDVSVQWSLTKKLKDQSEKLQEKSDNLKVAIDNLYEVSHKNKVDYIQNQVHDILGQHISYMLMLINEDKPIDYQFLKDQTKGLVSEIWQKEKNIKPLEQIENIKNVFKTIGVSLKLKGELPKEERILALLLDIVREATTNAVRHGFATEIVVDIDKVASNYYFSISNNGHLPANDVAFGSGLLNMKNKVNAEGGSLSIDQTLLFTIKIYLPGGDISEEGINS